MTARELCMNIFHYKDVDRMPAVHFGYWGQLLDEWAGQGHITKELAEAHKKGNKYLISSDDYDDYVRLLMTRRVMSVVFLVITLGIVALLLYPLLSS